MSEIKDILARNSFRFNKKFGQNFITDTNLLDAIIADAGITAEDTVLEIGPGAGTLTARLAAAAKKVIAYEIDENLRPVLAETLADHPSAEVVFKDVAKVISELTDYTSVGIGPHDGEETIRSLALLYCGERRALLVIVTVTTQLSTLGTG